MLIIPFVVPTIAAPSEAVRLEELATQIVRCDFIGKIFRAVFVVGGVVGRDNLLAVNRLDIGIVKRVDVDRKPVAVQGNSVRERHVAENTTNCYRAWKVRRRRRIRQ